MPPVKKENMIIAGLKKVFFELFGESGPLVLRREMTHSQIHTFSSASEDARKNFVEDFIALIYPSIVSMAKTRMVRAHLYDILDIRKEDRGDILIREMPQESRRRGVFQDMAHIFMQYFGPAGSLLLLREMKKERIESLEQADDEEKLRFIDHILEDIFAEFMSGAKQRVVRSELLSILQVSQTAKSRLYLRSTGTE